VQTIAISIDAPTLKAVDRLRREAGGTRTSRSELILRALQQFVAQQQRLEWEEREREVLRKHGRSLNRDALAALEEQADP
jgi:metal-responsive CopG/Arc/MetJ family transcriptional regulator